MRMSSAAGSCSARTSGASSRRCSARECRDELGGQVGANHAATARQHGGLDDDAATTVGRDARAGSSVRETTRNHGTGSPASRNRSRVSRLSRATRGRVRRMPRQAQRARRARRDHRRPIADREDAVDRRRIGPPRRWRRRRPLPDETAPGWRHPTRDRRADRSDRSRTRASPQPLGRLAKHPGLISGRRRQQKTASPHITCRTQPRPIALPVHLNQSHLLCIGLRSTEPRLIEIRNRRSRGQQRRVTPRSPDSVSRRPSRAHRRTHPGASAVNRPRRPSA